MYGARGIQAYRVVVLTGLAGAAAEWRGVAARLPMPLEVVEAAVPGSGPDPTLAAAVDAAAVAVRAEPGRPPAVVVAHSMGALVAEGLLDRDLSGVVGFVLLDPSAEPRSTRSLSVLAGLSGLAEVAGTVAGRLPASVVRPAARALRRAELRHGSALGTDPLAPDEVDAVFGSPEGVATVLRGNGRYYRWAVELERLRRVRAAQPNGSRAGVPVRILVAPGREVRRARWLAGEWGARLEVVPAARHLMHLDVPERVASAVEGVVRDRAYALDSGARPAAGPSAGPSAGPGGDPSADPGDDPSGGTSRGVTAVRRFLPARPRTARA